MSKKQKLYKLRADISSNAQEIKYLLENAIYKSDDNIEKDVLTEIALEKSKKISKMSERIGIILKH